MEGGILTAFDTAWSLIKDYDSDVFENYPINLWGGETMSAPRARYEQEMRARNPMMRRLLNRLSEKGLDNIKRDRLERQGHKAYMGMGEPSPWPKDLVDRIYEARNEKTTLPKDQQEMVELPFSDGSSYPQRLRGQHAFCRNAPGYMHEPPLTPEGLEWDYGQYPPYFYDEHGNWQEQFPYHGNFHPLTGRGSKSTKFNPDGSKARGRFFPQITTEEHPEKEVCPHCSYYEPPFINQNECPSAPYGNKAVIGSAWDSVSDMGNIWDEDRYGILPFGPERLVETSNTHGGGPYGFYQTMGDKTHPAGYTDMDGDPVPQFFDTDIQYDRDYMNRLDAKNYGKTFNDLATFCPNCRGGFLPMSHPTRPNQEYVSNPSFAGVAHRQFGQHHTTDNTVAARRRNVDPLTGKLDRIDGVERKAGLCSRCMSIHNRASIKRFMHDRLSGDSAIRGNEFFNFGNAMGVPGKDAGYRAAGIEWGDDFIDEQDDGV